MPKSTDRNAIASSDASLSIALIEDNRVVREWLAELLGEDPEFRVVHAAAFSDVAAIRRAGADLLLLDIGLENGDSLDMARNIGRELPACRIIVMDLLPSHEDIRDFVAAGVAGFILKDASVEELKETIRAVAGGADILPTSVTHALFSQIANHAIKRGPQADDDIRLTSREREVLDLIAEGLSNKAIAARLHISTHTVKSHVRNIMEKLTLHTRLQLAAWAHHEGEGEN
jgi:two-component system nitrate/nitrite response regulator NarL